MVNSLDTALEGRSDHYKQKVLDVVRRSGINTKDPLFLVLSSLGKFEVLMEEIPAKLETVVETWTIEIDNKLDQASSVAIIQQKSAIAKAAVALLKKGGQQKSSTIFGSVLPFVLLFSAFGLGILVGIPIWRNGEPVRLSFEEKEALIWAKSNDGQFARQFMRWNDFDINVCRQEPERLKGRCVLWVVPYEKRFTYTQQLSK